MVECPACGESGEIRMMDWSLYIVEPCGHLLSPTEYEELTGQKMGPFG